MGTHLLFIALTAVIAGGLAALLVATPARWLADDADFAALTGSRAFRPSLLITAAVLLAAVAAALFPIDQAIPHPPEWTAHAPGSGTTLTPPHPTWIDFALTSLSLGAGAAVTPVLFVTDLQIRRLPDRIVYPLIVGLGAAFITGILIGNSTLWWFALLGAVVGILLFGAIHLVGRLVRKPTMGLGDVKLAFVVAGVSGLFSPWAPLVVLLLSVLIAGAWALIAGLRAHDLRATTIPFGPAMLSGLWLGSVGAPFVL
ncbi:A24 family peptidase [Brevibacterium sp. 2SA]|uniref:prepilin peptidase n=1 Tax=Brevibacterium sp. 2SA TaxID=2502198 RepID=UPI0010F46729|nr:A24 family peptidase [Brevibacterium sp. 2SA]